LKPTEQPQVLGRREILVDRCVLPGDSEQLANPMGLAPDVDAEDLRLPAVDRQERREHLQHRGLARPVRAEHAEDLSLPDL
jgi:hypothetical protein